MLQYIRLRFIFLFFSFLFLSAPLYSQWPFLKEDADSLIREGSNYIYNVQFDKAAQSFKKVIEKYPDNPAGYFLDAMIEWWKITLYRESESIDKSFLAKIDKVLTVCDKKLEKNPFDINALFFKGGALGYRGRFYSIRQKWIPAVRDGKAGFDLLVKCWELAPNNHDIMLGTGIYNYFAEVLPQKYPGLKPISSFMPSGDKKIGILQLEAAGRYARYSSTEAKVILLQIFYQFEEDFTKSLAVAEDLYKIYPNNPYFHRYLGRSYVAMGMRDKWEAVWREILNRCISKQLGYDRITSREALYYVGTGLMYRNDLENALKYLYKCDEASRYIDKEPSGFMVRTNLYIGQIFDKQGKRKYAIQQYEKIVKWKDYQGSQAEAQRYIQKPYGK
ncbi:MAG: tetratricopeptide repeat protein [Bacteroidota bacterium]|jgi:tetratricopeptide (TPR) repeat protein